ncbi:MAG: hypothetical protein R2799_00025 [Crocinitomicaceae bacterium]
MSAVVKTLTPFINKDLLLKALDAMGCKYSVRSNVIYTDRVDFRGQQKFVLQNGRYVFQHDSDADSFLWKNMNMKSRKTVRSFLETLEKKYQLLYNKRMEELEQQRQEEERARLEKERQVFVESQRENIIAKAKEQGYSIQEEKIKGKIKLILVRNTY